MAGPGKVAVSALACKDCGAPMYPDMAKGGMSCAYCGHFVRFAPTDEDFTPSMTFRHQPLEIVDGFLKLGHVAIMDKDALKPPPPMERKMRRTPLDEKIRAYDASALDAINDEAYIEMNCPHCGKKLTPRLTDNIFTCPHCGQKFGDFDKLSTGDFDANLIVGRKYNFFGKCLPFPTPGKIRPGSQRKSNRGSFWKSGKFLILRDRGKGGQYERKNGGRHRSDRGGGGVSPRW